MQPEQIQAYLDRIGSYGPLSPMPQALRELQVAHLLSVPFENLDIHSNRPVHLDFHSLYDKIVVNRRGGFCYELNGLFAGLLQALGFSVALLSASDHKWDGSFGPPFDHLTLLVQTPQEPDERWLVDVGWGDTFREPLRIDEGGLQVQGERAYQIERDDSCFILRQRDADGTWETQYRFTLQPHQIEEFEPMCRYHQTSPESMFTQKLLCTLATSHGRITLSGQEWIETTGREQQVRTLSGEAEFQALLRDRFGVHLESYTCISNISPSGPATLSG